MFPWYLFAILSLIPMWIIIFREEKRKKEFQKVLRNKIINSRKEILFMKDALSKLIGKFAYIVSMDGHGGTIIKIEEVNDESVVGKTQKGDTVVFNLSYISRVGEWTPKKKK